MPSFAAAGAACSDPFSSSVVPAPSRPVLALVNAPFAALIAWRNRRLRSLFSLLVGFCLFGGSDAKADMIFVGGYGFQENAFATSLQSSYTSSPINGGFIFDPLIGGASPSSLSQSVVGPYVGDFSLSLDSTAYLQLGFASGIRNGPGADLALFETGSVLNQLGVSLAPSTSSLNYSIYSTTFTNTYFGEQLDANRINVALVDLSAFGVADGERLGSMTVLLSRTTESSRPTFTAAGALYPDPIQPSVVPAPPGIVLALIGVPFLGLGAWRKWRPQAAALHGAALRPDRA